MAATKRKRSAIESSKVVVNGDAAMAPPPAIKRRTSSRGVATAATAAIVDPDVSIDVLDGPNATRASPDSDVNEDIVPGRIKQENEPNSVAEAADGGDAPNGKSKRGRKGAAKTMAESELALAATVEDAVAHAAANGTKKARGGAKVKKEDGVEAEVAKPAKTAAKAKKQDDDLGDPEAGDEEEADEEEVKEALSRPPPVHSDYLPLPWKGRLGYACLNTYLRNSNPPVFSSRTCRIQSILEHRHPLQDPSQPEHPTKNRPDKSKPADVELGQRYVEALCLANVKDIEKMLRWNDRYNIKFLRLSSEMFPFASHPEYGYKLAPFAAEALAEAGKVVAELGHRVTTHPGQFTQLGSPRKQVIDNAIRDLEYHDEMLSLLRLPDQLDKDAIMVLHMGGIFEGKAETLQRFRENYPNLSQSIKNRIVLENDDMGWSVHDLLPVCEELNIPLVLDYHHNNIVFNADEMREGTRDIMDLYPRIKATWDRKGIRQKMHYSEPTPPAITPRQRRKHNPRVASLPPCAPDMDLMIEAKDKEQAVFELMRTFKLPGFETFNDIIPYTRNDDNKVAMAAIAKKSRSKKKAAVEDEAEEAPAPLVPEPEIGMGGPEGRVYWPPGMEEWLRPKKREVKKKEEPDEKKAAKVKKEAEALFAAREAEKAALRNGGAAAVKAEEDSESDDLATPATKKAKAAMRKKEREKQAKAAAKAMQDAGEEEKGVGKVKATATATAKTQPKSKAKPAARKKAPLPSPESQEESELSELEEESVSGSEGDEEPTTPVMAKRVRPSVGGRQSSGRAAKKAVKYNVDEEEDVEME